MTDEAIKKTPLSLRIRNDIKIEAQVRVLREHRTLTDVIERLLAAWVVGEIELPEEIVEGKFEPARLALAEAELAA